MLNSKLGITELKDSYAKLHWFKKFFFPSELAGLLKVPVNSTDNGVHAMRVCNAYFNSSSLARTIFSCLRIFGKNPIINLLNQLEKKHIPINVHQFSRLAEHEKPESFCYKLIAVNEAVEKKEFSFILDEKNSPEVIEAEMADWKLAGVSFNNLLLSCLHQKDQALSQKLIDRITDQTTLERALISAATNNFTTIIEKLLNKNVNINCKHNDITPLKAAVINNHFALAENLFSKGATATDKILERALNWPEGAGLVKLIVEQKEVSQDLLDKIINKSIQTKNTATPLLLNKIEKNRINHQDSAGDTFLIKAVRANNLNAVQELLDAGANVDVTNKKGYTAYMIAKSRKYEDCADLIAEKNPSIGLTTWAKEVGKIERTSQNKQAFYSGGGDYSSNHQPEFNVLSDVFGYKW